MAHTKDACPICRECHRESLRGLSFDGFGVNSCGEYRARIATVEKEYRHMGSLLAAAPELLGSIKNLLCYLDSESDDPIERQDYAIARAAISKAESI